ncbi:MAG: RHS repeat domain-containing protein, partial [Planctomycetota bacterium]
TLPTSGTAALYYHRNQQYSIVGLSDAAGTLVERYAYTAYGELTILAPDRTVRTASSFQNRYTYTGREWDPALRLYHFRARWLEPKAGRFIGRDPLGYVDGMGLYGAYLGLSEVDPTGLTANSCLEDIVKDLTSGVLRHFKDKLIKEAWELILKRFARSFIFRFLGPIGIAVTVVDGARATYEFTLAIQEAMLLASDFERNLRQFYDRLKQEVGKFGKDLGESKRGQVQFSRSGWVKPQHGRVSTTS